MMKMTIFMKIRHHSIFNDLETDMDWERLRENPNEIPYYIPTSKSEYISILEKQSVNQKTILELKQIINQNNINNILSLGCGRASLEYYLNKIIKVKIDISDLTESIKNIKSFNIFNNAYLLTSVRSLT